MPMSPDRFLEIVADGWLDTVPDSDLPALREEVRAAAADLATAFDDDPAGVAAAVEALAAVVAAIDARVEARAGLASTMSAALAAMEPAAVNTPATPPAPETPPVVEQAPVVAAAAPRLRPSTPTPPAHTPPVALVASGGFDGLRHGDPIINPVDLGREMAQAQQTLQPKPGESTRAAVAGLVREPRPVVLGRDSNQNLVDLTAVGKRYARGELSLTAAAGPFCAPAEVVYDFFDLPSAGLWQLPTVDAARGQTNYPVSPSLADIAGDWAAAVGSQTDPKTVFEVPCGENRTYSVVSYPTILRFDNFTGRFYPELVADVTAKSPAVPRVRGAAGVARRPRRRPPHSGVRRAGLRRRLRGRPGAGAPVRSRLHAGPPPSQSRRSLLSCCFPAGCRRRSPPTSSPGTPPSTSRSSSPGCGPSSRRTTCRCSGSPAGRTSPTRGGRT